MATKQATTPTTDEKTEKQEVKTVEGTTTVTQVATPVGGELQIADASSVAREAGPLSAPDGTPVATRKNYDELIKKDTDQKAGA